LSGADFPVVWPPPGEFELTIDPEASTLSLPTVIRDPLATQLAIGESPPPPHPPVEDLADTATWDVESKGNQTVFRRHLSSAEFQPTRNNLTYTTDQTWTVRVDDDDPGTTAVDATSRLSLSRPGWEVEVDGSISISGAEALRIRIVLKASHNGEEIWSKTWDEAIPRVWV
jgi:hypothetical protein